MPRHPRIQLNGVPHHIVQRGRNLVITAITSQVRTPLGFGEALVANWQSAGLIKLSVFKPVFATIGQGLVVRTLGALSMNDSRTLREAFALSIG